MLGVFSTTHRSHYMKYKNRDEATNEHPSSFVMPSSSSAHVKDDRLLSAIHTAAAEFINRESNRRSLVTVTKVSFQDEKNAHIFVSVYPPKDLHAVMDFLGRQEKEFLSYMKKSVKLHFVPKIRFLPDPDMGVIPTEPVEEPQ